jgi:alpha-amylase
VRNVDTDAGFDAYHGYWAQDLTLLNPHFGDLAALRRLVRECHARNMKVVVDIVTNHMGQMFFYDINNNGQPDEFISGSGRPDNDVRRAFQPRQVAVDPLPGHRVRPRLQHPRPRPGLHLPRPRGRRARRLPQHARHLPRAPRTDILASQAILASARGVPPPRAHRDVRQRQQPARGADPPRRLPRRPQGRRHRGPRVRDAMVEAYWRWVRAHRHRRLPHRHHQARRARVLAELRRRASAPAARRGQAQLLHVRRGLRRRRPAHGSYTNPNEMDSVVYFPRSTGSSTTSSSAADGNTRDAENLLRDRHGRLLDTPTPQPNGIGVPPNRRLVNFMDNHDVSRFLYGMNPTVAEHPAGGGTQRRASSTPATPRTSSASARGSSPPSPTSHRRRHPLPLLRHRAGLPRRQRPVQPRAPLGLELRRHRGARTGSPRPSRGPGASSGSAGTTARSAAGPWRSATPPTTWAPSPTRGSWPTSASTARTTGSW